MANDKPNPRDVWNAIVADAEDDELAEKYRTMSVADLDAELRAGGHDPDALRAEGARLAARLTADRERLAWQVDAAEALARQQARVDANTGRYADTPRAEVLARIEVACRDPRLAQPVAVMYRNRQGDDATDDELRALLEEIEALAERKG